MRFIGIIAASALALGACASDDMQDEGSPHRPLAVDDAQCPTSAGSLILGVRPAIARQGASLTLSAALSPGPYAAETLPVACLQDVQATPAGLAAISTDRSTVSISPHAPPGATIVVSARYGERQGQRELRVVGRDQIVLTGIWQQDKVTCERGFPPDRPVQELKFADDGSFGVTWQPFESYVDYWGQASFDPATGAFSLRPTGGNYQPPIVDHAGLARLDGERRLVLEGVFLGNRQPPGREQRYDEQGRIISNPDGSLPDEPPSCTYEFVR